MRTNDQTNVWHAPRRNEAVPTIEISGAECVRRLVAAGFDVVNRAFRFTTLRRDRRRVVVPDVGALGPDLLSAIARSAGLLEEDLLREA